MKIHGVSVKAIDDAIIAYEANLWQPIETLPSSGHVMLADDHGNTLPVFVEHYSHCEGDPD